MCKESENEREIEEQFDLFMRQTIRDEGNKLRIEKGLPPLTEEEMEAIPLPDDEPNGGDTE